jgi:proteasome assembly chaperone (PAC2) family protein
MSEALTLWEKPEAEVVYMLAGWRQWADGGSTSSGLPQYLIQQLGARQIGAIQPDGFYLFQIPGTHDLVRPVVRFEEGYPEALQVRRNELYYAGNQERGLVIFLGDEPHLDIERYTAAFLDAAQQLRVRRVVGLGGVYGELPYDKERLVSSIYSLPRLKDELKQLAVNMSNYHGGASIGSYICRRAGDEDIEFIGFYTFVPTYDFSKIAQAGSTIRVENDYTAWLNVMRRIDHMLKLRLDLSDLEQRSERLLQVMDAKVDEIEKSAPQLGVRAYLKRLSDEFEEMPFNPLDEVWEEELRRLLDKFDDEKPQD